ncbi:hypothetical protein BD410DRAFT_761511 [Rickenella mellea]|uniref:Uncharacterized protein n=1 Tax=Rickenella mellea TaxID=50990 RepID=A0A4Y7QLI6_9AGAM|nr:hypothetical protein BD410DRAFT_761511 [Rickenella mellea]
MTEQKTPSNRTVSASEVARSLRLFETWSTFQSCEQVAYSDIPSELQLDVSKVFEFDGQLPLSWVKGSSEILQCLIEHSPDLVKFIQTAHTAKPALFTNQFGTEKCKDLFSELNCVFVAWRQLQDMRSAKEKWSEADFAANVYNVFRTPAIRRSAHRTQCSISLPQHFPHPKPTTQATRVLRARTVMPDCAIFVRADDIRHLSLSKSSPWKTLNSQPSVKNNCNPRNESAFRYQTSPCAQLPESACFEFISSFWEDKKPAHELLEQAYRQNRMATTAAVRHLHSLRIQAPVFGLVWANGTVRAHVDWWACDSDQRVTVHSAPYPGKDTDNHNTAMFHEWNLDLPADILEVYILIRNIDVWTAGRFRDRVELGIKQLARAVVKGNESYFPWKRHDGNVLAVLSDASRRNSENVPPEGRTDGPKVPLKSKKQTAKRVEHRKDAR